MSEPLNVYLFGHSFVKRLDRMARQEHQSVEELLGLAAEIRLTVEGHPGLSYDRLFNHVDYYCQKMRLLNSIDVLVLDIGTNDLCLPEITPEVLVGKSFEFLDLLESRGISPRKVVFLSIIQRSKITRSGQVAVTTFNHRTRRFNSLFSRRLRSERQNVYLFTQKRVNYPKYLSDGCHLNIDGMNKYCKGLRAAIVRHGFH